MTPESFNLPLVPAAIQPTFSAAADFDLSPMRRDEAREVAQMHYDFFGADQGHGSSIANFGPQFLENFFYGLNLDNPYFFVDVARLRRRIIAFSVYASDSRQVFREPLRRRPGVIATVALRVALRHPLKLAARVAGNLAFISETTPQEVRNISGWYFLLGVKPAYRSQEFKQRTGLHIAELLWHRMERTLASRGCDRFWTVVGAHNAPMNNLHHRMQMQLVSRGKVQGLPSNFYVKTLGMDASPIAETSGKN